MEVYAEIAEEICTTNGQCVLLLGPELSVNHEGLYYKSFFKQLAENDKTSIMQYFDRENIFMFNSIQGRDLTARKIRRFYSNVGDKTLLESIARIKFPLIINACPDKALNKVFEDKYNLVKDTGYFYEYRDNNEYKPKIRIESTNKIPYPSKNLPVIYNIFGDFEDINSLIFDHESFYRTVQLLMAQDAIPPKIEAFLSKASSFVFLGFDFKSWHYQLMCHKLGLGQSTTVKNGLGSLKGLEKNNKVQFVMHNHFKVSLTDESPALTIEELIKECEARCTNSLRDPIDNDNYEVYVSYAWDDRQTDIIELLTHIINDGQLSNEEKSSRINDLINKSGKTPNFDEDLNSLFSQTEKERLSAEVETWYNTLPVTDKLNDSKINYSRETIVTLIEKKLAALHIKVLRDKHEVTFGDSIDSFMTRIGKGKAVIRIVSDKYLKSRYCMDEAIRIKKHANKESRIFTVVLADSLSLNEFAAGISDNNNIQYKSYWELLIENIYSKIDLQLKNRVDKERVKRYYSIYLDIYEYIIEFIQSIQDSVRLDLEQHKFANISMPPSDLLTAQQELELDSFISTIDQTLKQR